MDPQILCLSFYSPSLRLATDMFPPFMKEIADGVGGRRREKETAC